jgi:hypothetical protein
METMNDKLKELAKGNDLKSYVANWILEKSQDYDQYDERTAIEGVLNDLFVGGCQSGIVSELIYYADTTAFYDKYEDVIWELLERQAEELGHSTPLELISSFNGAKDVGNNTQFKNLLAWYAFEETAREISYELEIEA